MGDNPSLSQKHALKLALNYFTFLNLGSTLIDTPLTHLAEALISNKTVTDLVLNDNKLGSHTLDLQNLLTIIQHNKTITSLELRRNPLGAYSKELIEAVTKNPIIESFDLSGVGMNLNQELGQIFVQALEKNKTLRELRLHHHIKGSYPNTYDDQGLIQIKKLLKTNTSLVSFSLNRSSVSHPSHDYYELLVKEIDDKIELNRHIAEAFKAAQDIKIAKASGEVLGKHLPSDVALIVNEYSGLSTDEFKKGSSINATQITPPIPNAIETLLPQKEWRGFVFADLAVGLAITAVLFAVGLPVIAGVMLAVTVIGALVLTGAWILAKQKAKNKRLIKVSI